MSYESSRGLVGKKPFTIIGIVLDYCALEAGVAPCTAVQTGDLKCYKTLATCNDVANYTRTTKEYQFCQPRSDLPVGINLLPIVSGSVKKAPATISSGKGLGDRAVVTVRLKDFPHHDRGIDPYVNERTYDSTTRGTFWPRFLKRNPYYEGRTLKVYTGYINTPFSWSDFQVQEYDVTDISGPYKGEVAVTGKDILIRTYKEKSQYPNISNGTLVADISSVSTEFTLSPSGIGDSEYPVSGTAAIGSEAITFTRVGDVCTITGRGGWGTSSSDHSAGDVVQLCIVWESVSVVDVLYELLVSGASIPATLIPYDNGLTGIDKNWDEEKKIWLGNAFVTGILMKPEEIDKVIGELSEQFMVDVWRDQALNQIKIKALAPETPGTLIPELTDEYSILEDTLQIKRSSKDRITEVQVWYRKINYSEDNSINNFSAAKINVDLSRASPEKYGTNSRKVILSRWIKDNAQAVALAGRLYSRYADTPETITFEISVKDEDLVLMGGRVNINSWQFQDSSGLKESRKFQVTGIQEQEAGHSLKVDGMSSYFAGRYWFIAPDGIPDYSSASEEQKNRYGFISYEGSDFLDGTAPYKII